MANLSSIQFLEKISRTKEFGVLTEDGDLPRSLRGGREGRLAVGLGDEGGPPRVRVPAHHAQHRTFIPSSEITYKTNYPHKFVENFSVLRVFSLQNCWKHSDNCRDIKNFRGTLYFVKSCLHCAQTLTEAGNEKCLLIRDRRGKIIITPAPKAKDTLHSILKILLALYSSKYKEILNSPRQIMKEHEAIHRASR